MTTEMKYSLLLVLISTALAAEDNTLGMSQENPGASCDDIYQRNPTSRGKVCKFWIKTDKGLFEVTCNMKLKCGDVEGGWMQVVDVDMNQDKSCPGTWRKVTTPRNLCVYIGNTAGCSSAHFNVKEVAIEYQHICGQAKAFQKGSTEGYNAQIQSLMVYMLRVYPSL